MKRMLCGVKLLSLLLLSIFFFMQCAGPTRTVKRVQVDETIDLSGRWNDSDARMTAEAMVQDVLSRPWLEEFKEKNGRKPVVIIGPIRNRTSEHIEVAMLTKHFERELINSGLVKFVAASDERKAIRDERMDQQSYASSESAKELANELGADFMLQGIITSVTDSFQGKKVVKYQANFELIDIESNTKVWIGQKEIKKYIEQDRYSW